MPRKIYGKQVSGFGTLSHGLFDQFSIVKLDSQRIGQFEEEVIDFIDPIWVAFSARQGSEFWGEGVGDEGVEMGDDIVGFDPLQNCFQRGQCFLEGRLFGEELQ